MYHSLYFTSEDNTNWSDYNPLNPSASVFNTYGSWGLIATERPMIAMPPVKTNYKESDRISGSIDLTDAYTKVPVYGDRTGSITFYVTEPGNWPDLMVKLAGYLHGKKLKMWLEDDPEYYYVGRWAVNSVSSSEKFSTIQLDYTLYPFKISKLETTAEDSDWLWDDMNFDNGRITNSSYVFTFDTITTYGDSNLHLIHYWEGATNWGDSSRVLSQGIVTPIITWTALDNNDLDVRFKNTELGIDTTTTLVVGTSMRSDMQFSNLSRTNHVQFYAHGRGTVAFRMRRLMF